MSDKKLFGITDPRQLNKAGAFTLVELIVVIVILSILSTIAFLSFSNQSSAARDSTRLSDLSNIAKGMSLNQTIGGTYPLPERNIKIYSKTGTLIGFQGEAGKGILDIIRFSAGGGKDPLDNAYYTYSTNLTRNKYQLLSFLENSGHLVLDMNPFGFMELSATDYPNRYPYEKGDTLGIILSKTESASGTSSGATVYTPLQDIAALQASSTGFIIEDAIMNTGMIAIQDNSTSSVSVTVSNLEGFTTPVNPVKSSKKIAGGSDITSSTDLYSLSDKELKYIFESGSYYTQNWSSFPCNSGAISIVTMNDLSAAFTIPENTIVKVPDGIYTLSGAKTTSHITFGGNCSALVGQSKDGVILNSGLTSGGSFNGAIVYASSRNNVMIINLAINGNRTSPNRYRFTYQFYAGQNNVLANSIARNGGESILFQSCTNSLIANSQSFDNTSQGFMINNGSNNMIRDSVAYNNYGGFHLENGAVNNIINNSISYNNTYGFLLDNSRNNSFNNTISFNNSYGYKLGIGSNGASNNFFNNMQSFNNLYGFWNGNSLGGGPVILNGGSIYNNNIGFLAQNTSNNRYYGSLRMFGSTQTSFSGTTGTDTVLLAGSGGLLGWSDGILNTAAAPMDCSYHIRPDITANWGSDCEVRDKISAGITLPALNYDYGSNIQSQLQPIKCPNASVCTNGTNLVRYGTSGKEYDPAKKIGQR